MDGFPLSIECLCKSLHSMTEEMEALIKKLTLSTNFSDVITCGDSTGNLHHLLHHVHVREFMGLDLE